MSTINCLTNRKPMLHSYYSRCQWYQSGFLPPYHFRKNNRDRERTGQKGAFKSAKDYDLFQNIPQYAEVPPNTEAKLIIADFPPFSLFNLTTCY
jgi:hypothetical protein